MYRYETGVAPNGNHTASCAGSRQHVRFPLRMPVLCGDLAVPGHQTFGSTQNVSRGGLLLEAPEPLVPGTRTSLFLVAGHRNARAEAIVAWMAEGTPYRIGMRFTTWSGTDRLIWERLLAFQAGPTARDSVRFPISFDITCRVLSDFRLPGRVKNLSESGLMVAFDEVVPLHARVHVAVPSWITLSPAEVETEVMWARPVRRGHDVSHGLRFLWDDVDKELFLISALLRQVLDREESFLGGIKKGRP